MIRKKKDIEFSQRPSAFVSLSEWCTFSMGKEASRGDFLEVTEWSNGEGYDITINFNHKEERFHLTYGQLEALIACQKQIETHINEQNV